MQSLRHRLERFSLNLTPAALTVLLVLAQAVPFHIPGAGQIMPAFPLISIYYWNMFSPGMLPFLFLAGAGLLQDTVSGLPLGVSPLINIVFALLLLREHRNFGKAQFGAVWLGFVLLAFMAMILEWIIMSFYSGAILAFEPHILQWITTCFAYPPLHLLFTRIYRTLLNP